MIHRLILLDKEKSIGKTLYDDGTIDINKELLIGLVQALMMLGESLGPAKGFLREAELGNIQIALLVRDNMVYCVLQDSLDNEAFTRKLLDNLVDEYHDIFMKADIRVTLPKEKEIVNRVRSLLTSMKFPKEVLPIVEQMVEDFHTNTSGVVDTFFLSDLDDGVIKIFKDESNGNIVKIMLEILSEITFELQWIGETKLLKPKEIGGTVRTHEVWILHRIGITDYVIVGRAYYSPGFERDNLITEIEKLADGIQDALLR